MVTCEEQIKKCYLKQIWNGVPLKEEEKRERPRNSEVQELTTWNGSTGKNEEGK